MGGSPDSPSLCHLPGPHVKLQPKLRIPDDVIDRTKVVARRRSHLEKRDLTWNQLVREYVDECLTRDERAAEGEPGGQARARQLRREAAPRGGAVNPAGEVQAGRSPRAAHRPGTSRAAWRLHQAHLRNPVWREVERGQISYVPLDRQRE